MTAAQVADVHTPTPHPSGWAWKIRHLSRKEILYLIGGAAALAAAAWLIFSGPSLPAGFAGGNGRLEAKEIYVSTKYAGRIKDVLFDEGATLEAGQVVARMDTSALEAQLREAQAQKTEAEHAKDVALAQVDVKKADYEFQTSEYARSKLLVARGAVSKQEAEVDNARMLAARAELAGAQAQTVRAQASIEAAQAAADRLTSEIQDSTLVAPMAARVETRLSEPGEVLGTGGRVFSLTNLNDVFMYVFLPASVTGKLRLGSEARIVLDAAPDYPIPAFVSFISPMAQFTPKTVETAEERHNLTFRVKLQIDKNRLSSAQIQPFVKTGLPGMGYVRYDESAEWPSRLQTKRFNPDKPIWNPSGQAVGPS